MKPRVLVDFIRESNRIEGIDLDPTNAEIKGHEILLRVRAMQVADLCRFVNYIEPRARLRDQLGANVRVGDYIPPIGGPDIKDKLQDILDLIHAGRLTPCTAHIEYERLHPFTDGNGRSGRALWLWMHGGEAPLGFLHTFYYETLRTSR